MNMLERAIGDHDLVGLGHLGHSGGNVDVDSEVVAAELSRSSPVNPGAHSWPVAVDRDAGQRVLGIECRVDSILRLPEDSHQPVPQPLDDPPASILDRAFDGGSHLPEQLDGRGIPHVQRPRGKANEVREQDSQLAVAEAPTGGLRQRLPELETRQAKLLGHALTFRLQRRHAPGDHLNRRLPGGGQGVAEALVPWQAATEPLREGEKPGPGVHADGRRPQPPQPLGRLGRSRFLIRSHQLRLLAHGGPRISRFGLALVLVLLTMLVWTASGYARSGRVVGPVYVKVDDGTSIALCIGEPRGFSAHGRRKWPALFEMDGYGGCPSIDDDEFLGHSSRYVVVYAQVRGTGCSGGKFNLFSRRSSLDGKDIIDHWILGQPWSNGNVGITGHSYSGLTGFLVAATSPRVKAVAVSGLIDDFYRSILYPGGIFNEGFPVLWGGLLRPESEFAGNAQNYQRDQRCRVNQLQHQGTDTAPAQLIVPTYTQMTAGRNTWAIAHSLDRVERGLNAPIQINQQYQDEQTGPRGGYLLWQHVPRRLPKRLVLSNGQHDPNDPAYDKATWLDCYLIDRPAGRPCPTVTGRTRSGRIVTRRVEDPSVRVLMYFNSLWGGPHGERRYVPYLTSNWPAPETRWRTYYLHADHRLSTSSRRGDGSVSYVSTATDEHTTGTFGYPVQAGVPPDNTGPVTFTHGPNEARYTLPFRRPTAISGPILLNLWLQSTAPDTDVYADVLDYDRTTGQYEYLQRGLMRASFRAVASAGSDRISSGPLAGTIYRPYHAYLRTQLLTPGKAYRVPVEIFPLGHVFYPGHELVIDVHAPPFSDPLSTYMYEPHSAPAVNTILDEPGERSTLLLPLLPTLPPLWPKPPSCGQIEGYVCFKPVAR
jgi:predicted acyl esterase